MISINKKKNPFTQPIGRSRNVVGLDVEAGSIAATEVAVNGSVSVSRFGVAPLAAGAVRDGEVHDPALLSDSIKELFASQKFPKDVRVGIANQRVAVRTIRLPRIDDRAELETAIRFAAQDHIPMPLDSAVLDWQVIPSVPGDEDQGVEVVAVAARREMLAGLIEAVESAGLRLVGIDHSSFALIRALRGSDAAAGDDRDHRADRRGRRPRRSPAAASTATWATSQTSPSPARPTASSAACSASGSRASPSRSRRAAGSTSSTRASGSST